MHRRSASAFRSGAEARARSIAAPTDGRRPRWGVRLAPNRHHPSDPGSHADDRALFRARQGGGRIPRGRSEAGHFRDWGHRRRLQLRGLYPMFFSKEKGGSGSLIGREQVRLSGVERHRVRRKIQDPPSSTARGARGAGGGSAVATLADGRAGEAIIAQRRSPGSGEDAGAKGVSDVGRETYARFLQTWNFVAAEGHLLSNDVDGSPGSSGPIRLRA